MKPVYLILLLGLLLPELLQAQPWRRSSHRRTGYGYAQIMYFGIGGKYGVQYVDFNMHYHGPEERYNFKAGHSYHLGVSGQYFLEYNINLRQDILYTNRNVFLDYNYGEEVNPNDDFLPDRVDWNIGYITLPFRANYNYLYTQHLKGFLSAGLAPEIKTHDKESVVFLSGRTAEHFKLLYSRRFNRVNLAGTLSAGFKYNHSAHFAIEVEGGIMQYVGKVNSDYSKGPPRALYLEAAIFYDFQGF